jgi:trimeric autotransporter adhesin
LLGEMSFGWADNSSGTSLLRWGQDGLAFRHPQEVYVLRSKLVRDLTHTLADMSAGATGPVTGNTGSNLIYTLTISNGGPSTANQVTVTDNVPQGTVLNSASSSQGYCSGTSVVQCNLGTMASHGTATVTVNAAALTPGTVTNTAVVSAAQGDPNLANNTASSSTVLTGQSYNPVPALLSISPTNAPAGSDSFTLTVNGSQFNAASVISWSGAPMPTTFVSSTQLTAQIDSSQVATPGWVWVKVANPAPGGGVTTSQPFTVYKPISLDTNDILFDPFTRKVYASVPPDAPQLQGNSIVAIDPVTGLVSSPVAIGDTPGRLAESDDGQWLYVILQGSNTLARYNLVTNTVDPNAYSLIPPGGGTPSPRDIAVMPGANSTLAIDLGYGYGNGIYDIAQGTGAFRPQFSGAYTGSSMAFPDASHLYTQDSDTSKFEFYRWNVVSNGLTLQDGSTLLGMGYAGGGFRLANGLVYGFGGGLGDPSLTPPLQLAWYQVASGLDPNDILQGADDAPDPAINRVFFMTTRITGASNPVLLSFDQRSYEQTGTILFPNHQEGHAIRRWGNDGLALQILADSPGDGEVALLRGAFVLPTWGAVNPTPGLTALNPSTKQHGSGNFYLTVTGSNFVPGVVVMWNGAARTTTYIDAQHLKAAIPASDLASPGAAIVTAENPGSSPSGGLTFTIQ